LDNLIDRRNRFKSASSYISFTTDLYEISHKRCLSLSQINELELTPNETVTSNLHIFLNNQISKMDLIQFENNFNRAQLLLAGNQDNGHTILNNHHNSDELKSLVFISTKSEESDSGYRTQGCNFTDSILKEIKEQYDKPIILNEPSIKKYGTVFFLVFRSVHRCFKKSRIYYMIRYCSKALSSSSRTVIYYVEGMYHVEGIYHVKGL